MHHILARFSPLFVFHIRGASMAPAFRNGEKVLVLRFVYLFVKPKIHEVVIAKDPRDGKHLLKRIMAEKDGTFFLAGDNKKASTDSRNFGMIDRSGLIGKVICKI